MSRPVQLEEHTCLGDERTSSERSTTPAACALHAGSSVFGRYYWPIPLLKSRGVASLPGFRSNREPCKHSTHNSQKKRTLPPRFDSMGRFFDASGQQIARSTVPYWPVQRASRDRSDQSLLTRCGSSRRSWSTLTLRRIWYLSIMPRPHPTATSRASQSPF